MAFRIDESPDRLVVRDSPKGLWLFGSLFVTSGLIVLTVPFVSTAWHGFVLWERLAIIAIGIGHFSGGAWTVWRQVETITTFNRLTGDARSVRRHPFSWHVQLAEFKLADARALEIQSSVDSDGDPMYQLRLWLSGSRVVPLQAQPAHGRERAEANAATLRRSLGLPDIAATNTL
jgi:hypothetical protein